LRFDFRSRRFAESASAPILLQKSFCITEEALEPLPVLCLDKTMMNAAFERAIETPSYSATTMDSVAAHIRQT
jgi:hypothetical protein